jgi:hypothetical protein
MFGRLAKFMLIATAIAPIGFVFGWVAFIGEHYRWSASLIIGCGALIIICLYLLKSAKNHLERFPFEISSVEACDQESISFMLIYISPMFNSQFDELNLHFWIPTLMMFGLITATGYSHHFNPLLGLLGWHFFKVSSNEGVSYILITKKQLRRASQIKEVGQLTEYILIDLEGSYGC